jgi:hypothetical protein
MIDNSNIITVANNYRQDLEAARKAGVFAKNAMPKKDALYEAIESHNNELMQMAHDAGLQLVEAIDAVNEPVQAIDEVTQSVDEVIDLDAMKARLNKLVQAEPIEVVPQQSIEVVPQQHTGQTAQEQAAALYRVWQQGREAKAGAKQQQQQKKAKADSPVNNEAWSDESHKKAIDFAATKVRLVRARIISELCEVHSPKLVAEKLGLSEAKIRKEAKSYPLYLNNKQVHDAVTVGMGWSNIIDNIGSIEKLEAVCQEYINKDRIKRESVLEVYQ